jgi:hypothetical protein
MAEANPHQLTAAHGDWCGPVAVRAVTGATADQVEQAICDAAAELDSEHPSRPLEDTNFRHQARAVERLGFHLSERGGTKVQAHRLSESKISDHWLSRQPTSAEFLQYNSSDDRLLCVAYRIRSGIPEAHTFAVHRGYYCDNHTGGKVVTSVPNDVADFRIVRAFVVRGPVK